jgi:hypothetical protein
VVAVDAGGRVHAVGPGTGLVIGKAGDLFDTTQVTVMDTGVATVAISPAAPTVPVLGSTPLSAVYRNAAGEVVAGVPFTWTTLDPDIATVDPSGIITGRKVGETLVQASADQVIGQGEVSVQAVPATGPWPNEPSILKLRADQPWDQLGGLWQLLWGVAHIVDDPSAPGSPPGVLQIDFPIGFVGGAAPGTEAFDFPASREVYIGTWWMASDPWQGHVSNSNKIQYLFTPDSGSMAMIMYGPPSGPFELRVFPDWHGAWLTPNVANVPVTLGEWHQIEWLVAYGPTNDPPSGIVRWWLDGVLLGDYANVRLSSEPLIQYKLAPVWGGAETVQKTEADFFRYDHVRISTH